MDIDNARRELAKPLDRKHVKPAPKGKFGDYIEGWHAIAEANAIFGRFEWSYTVDRLECVTFYESEGRFHAAYMSVVTCTAHATSRQDVGFGHGHHPKTGDAHEGAAKEAVTDALKRCLRTFGDRFGLALYDKQQRNVRDVEADQQAARKMLDDIAGAETLQDLRSIYSAISTHFGGRDRFPEEIAAKIEARSNELKDEAA